VDIREQTGARQLNFDRYVLDLDRGSLLLDGNEIALRPKTFAVLRFLVENAGRLVSKDDLMVAVWPDVAVTDDALVQSIGELRRGLGDAGPRLIKTVPRRGYRFETAVSAMRDGKPDPATFHDGARLWTSVIHAHASRLFVTAFAGRGRVLLAALAAVVLIAAAALWIPLGFERKVLSVQKSGDQLAKSVGSAAKPAIAILPFVNQSDDAARSYFASGVTQDIISALGRFSALTVLSWNAVASFASKPQPPGEIARSLGVRYQVEGTVQRTGDRVRVSAQLVDTGGRVLWSARFDEALSDLFALQDKITSQIAGALAIRVTQAEQGRVLIKPTASLEAYDYVLRARPALQRPSRASIVEARGYLKHAIQLDPGYAAAYAALAETYHIDVSWGWAQSPADGLSRAEEMASKALSLNDLEQRARIIFGRVHIFHQRYEQAKVEMDRAIAINPSDSHGLGGRGNILMWLGQTGDAIEALELAQRIDPELNAIDRFSLGLAYYLERRYDAAIEQAELNLNNSESAHFSLVVLAAAYAQLSWSEDVARVVTSLRRKYPAFDPQAFGSKLRNPADLEHLRDGLRKAGL
jgi:adenylate cyclase